MRKLQDPRDLRPQSEIVRGKALALARRLVPGIQVLHPVAARHRASSAGADLQDAEVRQIALAEAAALTASDADVRLSVDISHPVTFGAKHPAVLLPGEIRAYPDDELRAIACREFIHVRRGDWLQTVGDDSSVLAWWGVEEGGVGCSALGS